MTDDRMIQRLEELYGLLGLSVIISLFGVPANPP